MMTRITDQLSGVIPARWPSRVHRELAASPSAAEASAP